MRLTPPKALELLLVPIDICMKIQLAVGKRLSGEPNRPACWRKLRGRIRVLVLVQRLPMGELLETDFFSKRIKIDLEALEKCFVAFEKTFVFRK